MSTHKKPEIICQNCEEHPLKEVWHDDIFMGYCCKSHNPHESGCTEYGCGKFIDESRYKELRLEQHPLPPTTTGSAHTQTRQLLQQPIQSTSGPYVPPPGFLGRYAPVPNRALALVRQIEQEKRQKEAQSCVPSIQMSQPNRQVPQIRQGLGQNASNIPQNAPNTTSNAQNISTAPQSGPSQPVYMYQGCVLTPGTVIPPSIPGGIPITVDDPEKFLRMMSRPVITPKQRLDAIINRPIESLLEKQKENYANMLLSTKTKEKNKTKKIKNEFNLKHTSSEEEEQRIAEEKRKGKFKFKKPKKSNGMNKKLLDATLRAAEGGDDYEMNGDETDDYDDSDNSDTNLGSTTKASKGNKNSGWDSDASEEVSSSEDEFDNDELYPETEQDRLDEEADQINTLLGDDDTAKTSSARQVFEQNVPVGRQDVITQERLPWYGYSNDQYEVYREPMPEIEIDPRFLKYMPVRENQRYGTLGVNWNALPRVNINQQFIPVQMIEKKAIEEIKSDKTLLFEQFQQERLARQLARTQIPSDYKPIRIWSPSEELKRQSDEIVYSSIEVPPLVGYKLRPHQREGVQFLAECVLRLRNYNGCGAILADDMGLGKTLQSVALIYTLLTQGFLEGCPIAKKVIVCCPTSLVQNWANEFEKWLGKGIISVVAMVDSGPKQKETLRQFTKGFGQVLVISYDTLRRNIKPIVDPTSDRSNPKKANPSATSDGVDLDDVDPLLAAAELEWENLNMFSQDGSPLCDLLICDEAHRLKNHQTQTYQSLNEIPCKRRVLLSGTPMQNDLKEFYSMINFANPELLGTVEQFSKKYQTPVVNGREPDSSPQVKLLGQERAYELSRIVAKFILRRTNTLLSQHLPPKTIEIVCMDMSPLQKAIYKIITGQKMVMELLGNALSEEQLLLQSLFQDTTGVGDDDGGNDDDDNVGGKKKGKKGAPAGSAGSGNGGKILPMLNMLRGVANHPKIVYDQLQRKDPSLKGELEEKILAEYPPDFIHDGAHPKYSGKIHTLDRLICAVRARSNDRFILISNFTETLDLVQQLCEYRNWKYLRVDGSTSTKNRQANVDKLCKKGSDYAIFLLSSKAGGCGLNLIGANRLVLIDPDWNPAVDKQAAGRIWRDGQTKRCFVYRFLSTGTIDEKIFQRQLSKDGLTEIMSGNNQDAQVTTDELKKLFIYNEDDNLLHPSDTHRTLDCACLSNAAFYTQLCQQHGHQFTSTMVHPDYTGGEKTDHALALTTSPENPFSRPIPLPDDNLRVKYPYQINSTPSSTDINNDGENVDGKVDNVSVSTFVDPAENIVPNPAVIQPPTTSRLSILPVRRNSSSNSSQHSQSSQPHGQIDYENRLPNLLQKGWSREQDLEYWSHHSALQTIPDPFFRDAIKDCYDERSKGKLNLKAFGDHAHQIRFNSQYSCNFNLVTMVMALEVTGKPLSEDPKGLLWRQFSSLTFRHGQPFKKMTKMDMDDDDVKFDPSTYHWDSEEEEADYIVNTEEPRTRLPLSLVTDPNEIEQRGLFFSRQFFRITSSRKEYLRLVRLGKIIRPLHLVLKDEENQQNIQPKKKRGGKGKLNSTDDTTASSQATKRKSSNIDNDLVEFNSSSGSGSDGDNCGIRRAKKNARKGAQNHASRVSALVGHKKQRTGKYQDGKGLGNGSGSDNYEKLFDDKADADDKGNLKGFLGESTDDDDEPDSENDANNKNSSSSSSSSGTDSEDAPSKVKTKSYTDAIASTTPKKAKFVAKSKIPASNNSKTPIFDDVDDSNDADTISNVQAIYNKNAITITTTSEDEIILSKTSTNGKPPSNSKNRTLDDSPQKTTNIRPTRSSRGNVKEFSASITTDIGLSTSLSPQNSALASKGKKNINRKSAKLLDIDDIVPDNVVYQANFDTYDDSDDDDDGISIVLPSKKGNSRTTSNARPIKTKTTYVPHIGSDIDAIVPVNSSQKSNSSVPITFSLLSNERKQNNPDHDKMLAQQALNAAVIQNHILNDNDMSTASDEDQIIHSKHPKTKSERPLQISNITICPNSHSSSKTSKTTPTKNKLKLPPPPSTPTLKSIPHKTAVNTFHDVDYNDDTSGDDELIPFDHLSDGGSKQTSTSLKANTSSRIKRSLTSSLGPPSTTTTAIGRTQPLQPLQLPRPPQQPQLQQHDEVDLFETSPDTSPQRPTRSSRR